MIEELGEMPKPQTEPAELYPGGVDAIEENDGQHPLSADLDPDDNPAVEAVAPDALKESEDTSTAATEDDEVDETEESPA
jgi:hypothetical protein